MTCESTLLQLIEAEPDELRRVVDTPLTRHLAGCARCAAVADRLIADTAQLAFAVRAAGAHPERRLSRWWLVPGMAAAAVAVLLWRGNTPAIVVPAPVSSAVTPPPPPAIAPTLVAVAEAPRSVAPAPRARSAGLRRVRVRPVPQLVAFRVEPVIVEAEPAPTPVKVTPVTTNRRGRVTDARGAVIVEPPPSKRATILRSAVPGVTVIWLN